MAENTPTPVGLAERVLDAHYRALEAWAMGEDTLTPEALDMMHGNPAGTTRLTMALDGPVPDDARVTLVEAARLAMFNWLDPISHGLRVAARVVTLAKEHTRIASAGPDEPHQPDCRRLDRGLSDGR